MSHPGKVLLSAQKVSRYFGAQQVLNSVSLTIHDNDRIGLIGRNGSGKSTLLQILAGKVEPDEGFTTRAQGIHVSFLEQDPAFPSGQTVCDALDQAVKSWRTLLKRWNWLNEQMASAAPGNHEYQQWEQESLEIHHRLDVANRWDPALEIKLMAEELHLPEADRKMESLSGGELRRVNLAKALLEQPDVLLLDEPTNHIDADSVQWIENYLENYGGACVLVTHDRYFLDRVTNRIVEINHGSLMSFPGNYARFLEYKASVEEVQQRTEANRLALIRREYAWYKRMPQARGTKQKARISRLMEAAAQGPPPADKRFAFAIPEPERLGKDILEARLLTQAYGDQLLFERFSLYMQKGMRIGIVGPNGCGKSTLLRVLMGKEQALSGELLLGATTEFLYVDQTLADMDPELTVLQFISDGQRHVEVGRQRIHVPSYLESFLFDKSCVDMPVGRLSGGEKRRVDLAKKLLKGGNFLILDEPTNDLDLYTLRVLEETIESFEGCALIVSHDRYLLNRLCTHMLIFEGKGQVVQIAGNYEDYLLYKERLETKEKEERLIRKKAGDPKAAPIPAKRATLSYQEKKRLENMEAIIAEAEEKLEALRAEVNAPAFFEGSFDETQPVLSCLEATEAQVSALYNEWMELEAKKEGSTS